MEVTEKRISNSKMHFPYSLLTSYISFCFDNENQRNKILLWKHLFSIKINLEFN